MASATWGKFYWSDWASDPRLKLCSFAAQGLWMRMLCIAAEHDPIGYLCVADRPLSTTDIARLTGGSEAEVADGCSELERNGVFSRDRRGAIYSRRMVRDAKKAAIARKNGKNGGNPSLCNIDKNLSSVKGADNPRLNTQIPEAREERVVSEVSNETSETCPKPAKRAPYPCDFEEFWKAYPTDQNMSKKEAFDAWKRMDANDKSAAIHSLKGFESYCRQRPDYRPIHANRYLLKRRFDGHLEVADRAQSAAKIFPGTPEWAAWLAFKQRSGVRTTLMEQMGRTGEGFPVPSRFPPTVSAA